MSCCESEYSELSSLVAQAKMDEFNDDVKNIIRCLRVVRQISNNDELRETIIDLIKNDKIPDNW